MTVLFICTGNTCRSPMAEAIAMDFFVRNGISADVFSRGVSAYNENASKNAVLAVKNIFGLELAAHVSKGLTTEDLRLADIVLAMTMRHKEFVVSNFPNAKVYTLGEFCGKNDFEVTDPYGGNVREYEKCAKEIADCICKKELWISDNRLFRCENKNSDGFLYRQEKTGMVKHVLAIGCDQAGYDLKLAIIAHLKIRGIEFVDFGTHSKEATDYPIYGKEVAKAVLSDKCQMGILICGTGIGISISANRYKGIRCALCHDVFSAKATRLHNDANILAMGGRVIGEGHALEIVDTFLDTPFSGEERHSRRIGFIEEL